MTPAQENELLTGVAKLQDRMELLITNGGSKGMIPEMQRLVAKHEKVLFTGRVLVGILAFIVTILATFFAGHVWWGKG